MTMNIEIVWSRCPKNHVCPIIRVCPAGAISQETIYHAPVIDKDKCTNCGKCVKFCGYKAFQNIL